MSLTWRCWTATLDSVLTVLMGKAGYCHLLPLETSLVTLWMMSSLVYRTRRPTLEARILFLGESDLMC